MTKDPSTITDYLDSLPEERKEAMTTLREVVKNNLPGGFEETINYKMIGYVIPHSLYPPGYHADPSLPLPFIHLASQKSHIALYHSGLYSDEKLLEWFLKAYHQATGKKPDMGKSCLRFKKPATVPYELIAELCTKMTAEEWIAIYENSFAGRHKKK